MLQVFRNFALVVGGVAASWVVGTAVALVISGSMVW